MALMADRCVYLVANPDGSELMLEEFWDGGRRLSLSVAFREDHSDVWGPPTMLVKAPA
jgi:hypothetical protein